MIVTALFMCLCLKNRLGLCRINCQIHAMTGKCSASLRVLANSLRMASRMNVIFSNFQRRETLTMITSCRGQYTWCKSKYVSRDPRKQVNNLKTHSDFEMSTGDVDKFYIRHQHLVTVSFHVFSKIVWVIFLALMIVKMLTIKCSDTPNYGISSAKSLLGDF